MLGLDAAATASRPARFRAALESTAAYERTISRAALEGFRGLDPASVRLFGLSDPGLAAERDPTFAFEVRGQSPEETKRRLWRDHKIQVADGNHYSAAVVRHLGRPALCRASFAHYDTPDAARRLTAALADISGT
jgi:selenocysteine lyase/cysteine desulfurase